MPGYDRTGPLRRGARTGRRLGQCGRATDSSRAVADPFHACGLGWGHWPEARRGGRRFGGSARGRGRGSARTGGEAEDAAAPDATRGQRRAFLWRRIEALTAELDSSTG
jgi:hypothetical protein